MSGVLLSALLLSVVPQVEPCATVSLEDERLEAAVRTALSVDESVDLTCDLVASLDSLEATEVEISSLEGIQSLTGLEHLVLWGNFIEDLSPLAGLIRLRALDVGWNAISDVGPLAGLTALEVLSIRENTIRDLGVLSGLTELENLDVSYNEISDIDAIRGMTALNTLRVYGNPITDISAMRGLTELYELHVHEMPDIETFQPLIDNVGLGGDDIVYIYGSDAPCSEVSALRNKGLSVSGCGIEYARRYWWALAGFVLVGLVGRRILLQRQWAGWRSEEAAKGA
jgi:hypothetical protein